MYLQRITLSIEKKDCSISKPLKCNHSVYISCLLFFQKCDFFADPFIMKFEYIKHISINKHCGKLVKFLNFDNFCRQRKRLARINSSSLLCAIPPHKKKCNLP